jgi:hypothetical protein
MSEENLNEIAEKMKANLELTNLNQVEYFKTEDVLLFNFKNLYQLDLNEFLNSLPKNNEILYYTALYFYCCKYISLVTDVSRNVEDKILSTLNNINFSHFVLDSYKYRISSYNIDERYNNLISEINRVKSEDPGIAFVPFQLNALFLNQIAFINFIEFTISYSSKDSDDFQKYQITKKQLSLLILYYKWKELVIKVRVFYNFRIIQLMNSNMMKLLIIF